MRLFTFLVLSVFCSCSYTHCGSVEYYFESSIKGKVIDKYRLKWNRNSRELDISEAGGIGHIYLIGERSGFWDNVQVGDSLIKESKSLRIHVIRGNQTIIYDLNHGCGQFTSK
jgi:hypothetical protein